MTEARTDQAETGSTVAATPNESRFAVFGVPGFAATYAVGVVWSMCRWGLGFLGAYVVTHKTGSPRLVQLTGAMLWAPLLLAGMVGGAVSDRFSRRKVLFGQFVVLCPLTVGVAALAAADRLPIALLYAYMAAAGFGWVIDMTVRRAMVYDIVGDAYLNRAMAFEGLSSSLGLAAGAMAGGALASLGAGTAYLVVAGAMLVAALLVLRTPGAASLHRPVSVAPAPVAPQPAPTPKASGGDGPRPAAAPPAPAPAGSQSFFTEVAEGLRFLGRAPTLLSILGVTAITNFFHFAYFPIVPLVAERVGASAFLAGFLAAATGFGMAVGSTFVITRGPARGRAYVIGATGAFLLLNGFALFQHYVPVYLSVLLASSFVGVFGATQSVLVMTAVEPHMRGRALGMLSMAIGWLPVGMYLLGELAQAVGASAALVSANVAGVACLWLFLAWRPQVLKIL
ncbi:MAG: MFS transporter [Acidimicrobiia bacterium]|nr:MFS transporter [Acidimicrobiia bacterium]